MSDDEQKDEVKKEESEEAKQDSGSEKGKDDEEKKEEQEEEKPVEAAEAAPQEAGPSTSQDDGQAEEEEKPKKKKGGPLSHCFPRRKRHKEPKEPKKTFYDLWGSYEVEPGVRANIKCQSDDQLWEVPRGNESANTLWHLFQHGLEISPNGNCLGWLENFKVYKWHSYTDVAKKVRSIAAALEKYGLERQSKIGIYSKTRPLWPMTCIGITSRSHIAVPLYDTLGASSCKYIINQTEMPLLFADSNAAAKRVLECASELSTLKTIVLFEAPEEDVLTTAAEHDITVVKLEEFTGEEQPAKKDEPKDEPEQEGTENQAFEDKEGDDDAEKGSQKSDKDEEKTSQKSDKEEDKDEEKASQKSDKEEDKPEEEDKKEEEEEAKDDDKDVFDLPNPDDVCITLYTSGTTGDPKGVVLTHSNMVSAVVALDATFMDEFGPGMRFTKDDSTLLYLPLAHAYGFLVLFYFLYRGAKLGCYNGDPKRIKDAAIVLKPTVMSLVPRLMNRVMNVVMTEINKSAVKKKLYAKAYNAKKKMMLRGVVTRSSKWDKLVFKKIQAALGGRVWMMTVGSAPISAEVLEWFRVVFGAVIGEGYGQTECGGVCSTAIGPVGGNVGHPTVNAHLKLADVPDSDYKASDGKGEVCIKGPCVMKEYYKMPEKTAETIDEDGWLHTGDIGEWQPDGSLKIIDRMKHIFKLAQGEYVAPEKIESVYALCPRVGQVFVDGNPLEPYTVAVIHPEEQLAETWAKQNGADAGEIDTNPDYIKLVLESILAVGKQHKLNSLEQVKSICLTDVTFSVDNNLLTPTFKNKRPELRKFFKDQIAALYEAGPMVGGAEGGGTSSATSPPSKS